MQSKPAAVLARGYIEMINGLDASQSYSDLRFSPDCVDGMRGDEPSTDRQSLLRRARRASNVTALLKHHPDRLLR